jgi:hypothetical protein
MRATEEIENIAKPPTESLKKPLLQDSKSHAIVSDLAGCVVAAEKAALAKCLLDDNRGLSSFPANFVAVCYLR